MAQPAVSATRLRATRPHVSRSVEDRVLISGALEFVEPGRGGYEYATVPQSACCFALRSWGDDRAEERDTADTDHRCADVVADAADAVVVGGSEYLVVFGRRRGGGERCREAGFLERRFEPRPFPRLFLQEVLTPAAHPENVVALILRMGKD